MPLADGQFLEGLDDCAFLCLFRSRVFRKLSHLHGMQRDDLRDAPPNENLALPQPCGPTVTQQPNKAAASHEHEEDDHPHSRLEFRLMEIAARGECEAAQASICVCLGGSGRPLVLWCSDEQLRTQSDLLQKREW